MVSQIWMSLVLAVWTVAVLVAAGWFIGYGYCKLWDSAFCACPAGTAKGFLGRQIGPAVVFSPICLGRED